MTMPMQAATELRCGRVWSLPRFDFLKRYACLGTVLVLFQLGGGSWGFGRGCGYANADDRFKKVYCDPQGWIRL